MGKQTAGRSSRSGPERFDEIDLKIARLLQLHARYSSADLAELAAIPRSTAWDRQKHLERQGLIVGYQAIIAPSALANDLDVVIRLHVRPATPALLRNFEDAIRASGLFHAAARIDRLGRYELRTVSRRASEWIEVTLAEFELEPLALDLAYVVEQIVPHRDPPITTIAR
jgi:DNA-binding Lrp family transcriptional regulator